MTHYLVRFKDGSTHRLEADSLPRARVKAAALWGHRVAETHKESATFGPNYAAKEQASKCMMRGVSTSGETRYCQYPSGHRGEHSYVGSSY